MILLSQVRGPIEEGRGTFVCEDLPSDVGSGPNYQTWNEFRNGRSACGVSACIYEDTPTEAVNIYSGTTGYYHGMYPVTLIKNIFVRIQVPPVTDPRAPYDTIDVMIDCDGDGTNPTFTVSHPIQPNWQLCLLGITEA